MRTWRQALGIVAGGLVGLGGVLSSASAQYPPQGGMPPGMGMPGGMGMPMPPGAGMPPGMGMPPGAGMGMPQGGGMGPGAFGAPPTGMPADFPNPGQPSQEPASPFSIKDDGAPNAFSELVDSRLLRPLRFQFTAGYSIFWFRGGNYPPLATTGNVIDPFPGAIGQPNTTINSGGIRQPGASNAFRTSMIYWLCDPQAVGVEGSFFVMENRSVPNHFKSDSNGNPVQGRPFFNTINSVEDFDPASFPGAFAGTLYDTVTTRLMGADLNIKWHSSADFEGAHYALFVGLRWLNLNERFETNDYTQNIAPGGFAVNTSDNFATYNQFYGGQFGAEYLYKTGRFSFSLIGKLALGPNYQTIRISGQTTTTDLTNQASVTDTTRGLFAQATNIGVYNNIRLAVMPEFGAKMNIELTERLHFHLGYTFLLLNNSVRPGDQLNRNIGIQPGNPPIGPAPPTFIQSTFYVNSIDFGLEFLF